MKKVSIDGGAMMQKDFGLCTSFNALYLAISEKVLTHTHTHTHSNWHQSLVLRVRARETAWPLGRDLQRNLKKQERFFCSFFVIYR